MTMEIEIRHSAYKALVDDTDYDRVVRYKWYLHSHRAPTYYARTNGHIGLFMHSFLLPAPKGLMTCHKDGNGLNNQRTNLIIQTCEDNAQSKRIYNNNSTGYPGVYLMSHVRSRAKNRWRAIITVRKKTVGLGVYPTFEAAVEARRRAEQFYKGEEDD